MSVNRASSIVMMKSRPCSCVVDNGDDDDIRRGMAIVIMGVSGAGKSTVGDLLGKWMGYEFIDADDFHTVSNKEKMKRGIGLREEDRIPWLETLRDEVLRKRIERGTSVILACSALRKRYRHILTSAADYKNLVKFVLLEADPDVLTARLEARAAQGKHFMSPSLLQSQLDLLEIDDDDEEQGSSIFKVDATLTPHTIVAQIKSWLSTSQHP